MWIFLTDAFLSVVADRDDPERLLVRARFAGDLERVFSQAEVSETPAADYRFRTRLPRATVAAAIAARLLTMMATNFKDAVGEDWRHDVCLDVWSTMVDAQYQRQAKPPERKK